MAQGVPALGRHTLTMASNLGETRVARGLRSLSAACVWLMLCASAQATSAEPALHPCPGLKAEVLTRQPVTVADACAGAADALGFLAWLPRDPEEVIRVELVSALPSGLRPDAVGCYARGSRRLMVLERDLFLQRGMWFAIPVSSRLWRAVIAHEVAHALVGCHLKDRSLAGAAHEYVAYVTMFATLDAATRLAALAAMPGEGFGHDAEINDFRYAFDPMRFGVDAYRHWLCQPDGRAYLMSIIRGSIVPEMPP
jgi:hypothetical protein